MRANFLKPSGMTKTFNDFKQVIQESSNKFIVLGHKQADLDSISATFALKKLIELINRNSEILIIIETFTKLSEKIIYNFKLKNEITTINDLKTRDLENYVIILVDTANFMMTDLAEVEIDQNLAFWNSFYKRICIDHHLVYKSDFEMNLKIIDSSYSSTAELVLDIALELGISFKDEVTISLIIMGILFDTKKLQIANGSTLVKVGKLLDLINKNLSDMLSLFYYDKELSEKIAIFKGLQRNKLVKLQNKYILSISHVSSYEASVARSIISAGSDIAIVINQKKSEFRISIRATNLFIQSTNLHCGNLANKIGTNFNGSGSGHLGAGGCNFNSPLELSKIIQKIEQILKHSMENGIG